MDLAPISSILAFFFQLCFTVIIFLCEINNLKNQLKMCIDLIYLPCFVVEYFVSMSNLVVLEVIILCVLNLVCFRS